MASLSLLKGSVMLNLDENRKRPLFEGGTKKVPCTFKQGPLWAFCVFDFFAIYSYLPPLSRKSSILLIAHSCWSRVIGARDAVIVSSQLNPSMVCATFGTTPNMSSKEMVVWRTA